MCVHLLPWVVLHPLPFKLEIEFTMIDSESRMNPTAIADKPIRDRYRIRFGKTGLLRWIGHHDLQRLWERLLRRADLRLSMSQGFHPKPRINFPSALALG